MTTIACDRYQMSADSRLADDSTIASVNKLFRHDGSIFGVSGNSFADCERFKKWIKKGGTAPRMSQVVAMQLNESGIWIYEYSFEPYRIQDPFCATGSGAQGALVAMYCGCDTKQAVKMAAKVDKATGGRVRTLALYV